MTSNFSIFSFKNLSLCVYIGNTSSINNEILLKYCSRFGKIISSSFFPNEKFCDFILIEYDTFQQLEHFLNQNIHEINRLILDVQLYKHILINNVILNIDLKFFIGPINNSKDIKIILEFYKTLDSKLHYDLIEQDKQTYLLFQMNSRQLIKEIFDKSLIPINIDNRRYFISKPLHPKKFQNQIISMYNKQNQIYIHGLTKYTTETILIDYFNKFAPVLACIILSNKSKYAVMEFNDKETVNKILNIPNIHLQDINLVLSKATDHFASLLSSNNESEIEDDIQPQTQSLFPSSYQQSFIIPTQSPIPIEPSPENNNESGWSSPPRTVFNHPPLIDQPSVTTVNMNLDLSNRIPSDEIDIKPIPSNNLLNFFEKFQNEINQIKDEYKSKFVRDRTYIDQQIDFLIDEERHTFEKLNRYLNDHRRRVEKRKHSPSSSINE